MRRVLSRSCRTLILCVSDVSFREETAGVHDHTPAAMSSVSTSVCGGGDAAAAQAFSGCEQALLSSDRYASLILAQMNKMRLRSNFCDVGLQVGSRVFKAHRLVLAASSPYFAALFSGGLREADKDEVQLIGVDTEVFEILLDFIYTGLHPHIIISS